MDKENITGRALCTNKTGVRGVYFHKHRGKYCAVRRVDGRQKHLGLFSSIEEATEAYLAAGGAPRMPKSYLRRGVEGRSVEEHRLIWEAANGPIPPGMEIDHVNGNVQDNRLENLRLATRHQNQWNTGSLARSSTGFKGVIKRKNGRFDAKIQANGQRKHLGCFRSAEEAAEAYRRAAETMHGDFAFHNRPKEALRHGE